MTDDIATTEMPTNGKGEKLWQLTLTRTVVLAIFVSLGLIFGAAAAGIVVTNQRATDGTHETQLLGKCVFNLLAYRAAVSESREGVEKSTIPPYADLVIPHDASNITLAPCQKYLDRIDH